MFFLACMSKPPPYKRQSVEEEMSLRVLFVGMQRKRFFTYYGPAPLPWTSGEVVADCFRKLPDFFKAAEIFLQKGSEEEKLMFVRLARKIWFHRNKFVFKGLFLHPKEIIQEVRNAMEEYHRANNMVRSEADRRMDGQLVDTWTAPDLGWHKANWDAARDIKKGRMGLGIVIRDQSGRVTAARSIPMQARLFRTTRYGGPGGMSCGAVL